MDYFNNRLIDGIRLIIVAMACVLYLQLYRAMHVMQNPLFINLFIYKEIHIATLMLY